MAPEQHISIAFKLAARQLKCRESVSSVVIDVGSRWRRPERIRCLGALRRNGLARPLILQTKQGGVNDTPHPPQLTEALSSESRHETLVIHDAS